MKRKVQLLVPLIVALILSNYTSAQYIFLVETPASLANNYDFTYSTTSNWGADMDTIHFTDTLVFMKDSHPTKDSLGCGVSATNVAGNIAVVYRGDCMFSMKAYRAQAAGARALVIINHTPGGPVDMGGGDSAAAIYIPVVMIGKDEGAALKAEIEAGNVTAFIGNKSELYANDIGFYKKDVVISSSFGLPKALVQNSNDFSIPVGAWIYNFGANPQTNVTLSAVITNNTGSIYTETTTTPVNLGIGENAFFSLPVFSQTSYDTGYYTLTYTIQSDSTDDFTSDDEIVSSFYINEFWYSKSRINPVTKEFITPAATRTTDTQPAEFTWCITLDAKSAGGNKVYGLSFSANTNQFLNPGLTLVDKSVEAQFWQWNDDISTNVTINDVVALELEAFYDYDEDLQNEFVRVNFNNSITLENNTKYLGCVKVTEYGLNIGYDNAMDYATSADNNSDVYCPIRNGDVWGAGGFGFNLTPAIIIHFDDPVGIEDDKTAAQESDKKAYPNPANDYISIPLKEKFNGIVDVQIVDITGKIIKSEKVNMSNTNILKLNTSTVENGMYFLHLRNGDNKLNSFPVIISH